MLLYVLLVIHFSSANFLSIFSELSWKHSAEVMERKKLKKTAAEREQALKEALTKCHVAAHAGVLEGT